jgi:hypothetical protein
MLAVNCVCEGILNSEPDVDRGVECPCSVVLAQGEFLCCLSNVALRTVANSCYLQQTQVQKEPPLRLLLF